MKTANPTSAKKALPPLGERAAQVLADVVETYGASGEPVGSKALVENGRYQLSGASIRNVMQDLEGMGLLMHPHTSAGRIPTEQGFRYYAQQLVKVGEIDVDAKKALDAQLSPSKSLSKLVTDVGQTLSVLTNCAVLVTTPKSDNDPLEQMEFIRMSADRVLVVMVTKNGEIENRVIEVPGFISPEDLQKAASSLKPMVMGHTLDQARTAMISALAEQKGQVNAMIDQMMGAAAQWGEPVTADGAMVVAGSTNLFQYPELVRDRLQALVKVFEEKRLLMALVEEVRQGDGVKIFVGNDVPVEGAEEVAKDLTIIASPYGDNAKRMVGSVGVIGPMRMNYKHTMSVVDYTSKLLGKVMNEK